MKKAYLILCVICVMFCTPLKAQEDSSSIISFPQWGRLYYDLRWPNGKELTNKYGERSNIERFFSEWESWSKLIAKGALPNDFNDIFKRHFIEARDGRESESKYIALPIRIKVIKYNRELQSDNNTLFESISFFTPVVESDKPVLYLTPEVEQLLSSFIEEPLMKDEYTKKENVLEQDWEELRKRRDMINEYVPTQVAHWGDGWYFTSYPLVNLIIIGTDGYSISLSNANYSGTDLFVPWGKDPIVTSEWIQ